MTAASREEEQDRIGWGAAGEGVVKLEHAGAHPHAPMQDLAMPPRQSLKEEAAPSSSAACSLLDLVALGPVQELIWSGLDTEDRQQLRETCRSLRAEVERSCTALKPKDLCNVWEGQAESLVKLSGRLPGLRTLHLTTAQAVQALSLDPPPAGEQMRACMGQQRPSSAQLPTTMRPPPLPP